MRATKGWPEVSWRGSVDPCPLERQRLQLFELVQRQRLEVLVQLQAGEALGSQPAIAEQLAAHRPQRGVLEGRWLRFEPLVVAEACRDLTAAISAHCRPRGALPEQRRQLGDRRDGGPAVNVERGHRPLAHLEFAAVHAPALHAGLSVQGGNDSIPGHHLGIRFERFHARRGGHMLNCGLDDGPGASVRDRQYAVREVLRRRAAHGLGDLRVGLALDDPHPNGIGYPVRFDARPSIQEWLEQLAAIHPGHLQGLRVDRRPEQRIRRHGRVYQQRRRQAAPLECSLVLRDVHQVGLHPIAEGRVDLQQLATRPPKELLKPASTVGGQLLTGELVADMSIGPAQVGLELLDLASLEPLKQYRVAAYLLQQLLVRRLLRFHCHRLCPG